MNPEERKQILAGKGKKIQRNQKQADSGQSSEGNPKGKGKGKERQQPMTWQEVTISWAKTILGALLIVMIVNGLLIQSFVVPTESMEGEVLAGDFLFVNRFIYGGSTPQTIPFLNIPLPYVKLPGLRSPEKGDVIVFIYPGDRDQVEATDFQYYLKRCVATAGDTLEVRNGVAYVNGVKEISPSKVQYMQNRGVRSDERYNTFPRGRQWTHDNWGPMRIPKEGDVIPLNDTNYQEWEIFIAREGHDVRRTGGLIEIDGQTVDSYTVERDYVFGMGDNRDNSLDSRFWGFVPVKNVVGTPLIVYWSWQNKDARNNEYSLGEKLGRIRWNRIFNSVD
ncbi:MAG: signal peptidase I [Ignavibacteriae bacterium]|nr:signal peptidase I [Ignavibacteriota bacterium]MCB9214228.1 signal peptidase I [Ignavibacteria bacterium]